METHIHTYIFIHTPCPINVQMILNLTVSFYIILSTGTRTIFAIASSEPSQASQTHPSIHVIVCFFTTFKDKQK